jgi:rSAM/selenodomain-associated transferase 1
MDALVLFAKFPEPGKVKKKIGKVIGMEGSARLCKAFIQDIIAKNEDKDYDLYLSFIGHEHKERYRDLFPNAILYVQRGTNLSENMQFTFEDLLDDYEKVIILSSDVPNVGPETVTRALNALESYDVVIGPAEDGGYYLIGMKNPHNIFEDLPWGKENLLEHQMAVLKNKKLSFVFLEKMPDVDDIEELKHFKKTLKKEDAPKTYEVLKEIEI